MRGLVAWVLLAGCVESASAQTPPRPDGGLRSMPRPASRGGMLRRPQMPAGLLRALSGDADGGIAAIFSNVEAAGVFGGLGGIGTTAGARGWDAGASGGLGRGRLGIRGVGPGEGTGLGLGGLGTRGPSTRARFEALEVTGPIPRWQVLSELSHQQARIHNCLLAAGALAPADVPLRFRVVGDGRVEDLSLDGASPALVRCATEHLPRALFGPSATPTEVTARLRVGAVATDGGVAAR